MKTVVSVVMVAWSLAFYFLNFSTWELAQEKTIALKGGKLLTVTHGVIENGVLLIQRWQDRRHRRGGSVKIPKDTRHRRHRHDRVSGADRLGNSPRPHRN